MRRPRARRQLRPRSRPGRTRPRPAAPRAAAPRLTRSDRAPHHGHASTAPRRSAVTAARRRPVANAAYARRTSLMTDAVSRAISASVRAAAALARPTRLARFPPVSIVHAVEKVSCGVSRAAFEREVRIRPFARDLDVRQAHRPREPRGSKRRVLRHGPRDDIIEGDGLGRGLGGQRNRGEREAKKGGDQQPVSEHVRIVGPSIQCSDWDLAAPRLR